MDDQKERIETIQEVVESVESEEAGPDLLTLSSGVVLEVSYVSPMVINGIVARYPLPKPPVVYIEAKGIKEPNPNHPEYLEALATSQAQLSSALLDAFIILGTKVVKTPRGIVKHDQEQWHDMAKVLGVDPSSPAESYVMWVKTIAAPKDTDVRRIMQGVGAQIGVPEEDVDVAVRRLKSREERGANNSS